VRRLVRALCRRLVAVERKGASLSHTGPLDATLLRRRVAKAAKAVTSHRTPNLCRVCVDFHECISDGAAVPPRDGLTKRVIHSQPVHPCPSVVNKKSTNLNYFLKLAETTDVSFISAKKRGRAISPGLTMNCSVNPALWIARAIEARCSALGRSQDYRTGSSSNVGVGAIHGA